MEQQIDVFTQKRMELIIEMATKKLQQEIQALKDQLFSFQNEVSSLKSQVSRLQFQPQHAVQKTLFESESVPEPQKQAKKDVKIVDCRPDGERKGDFKSGAEKNAEPIMPRYGDYEPKDVSIDKFFYFGRK